MLYGRTIGLIYGVVWLLSVTYVKRPPCSPDGSRNSQHCASTRTYCLLLHSKFWSWNVHLVWCVHFSCILDEFSSAITCRGHYCRGCQCCLALLSQKLVPNRRCQTLIEWPEWPKDEMNSKHTVSTARVWLAQRQGMSTQSSCNSKKGYFEPYPSFCISLHVPHRFLSWRLCNGVSDVDYLGTTLLQHHHEVVPFNMQVSVKRWWWVSMKLCIWMKLWNLFWQEHHSSKIMLLDVFWSPDLETLWRRPQHPRFDVVCSDKKLGGRPGYAEITSLTEIKLDVLKYRNHVMCLCANREEYNIIQYYIFVFHKACVVASQPDLHFRILSVDSRVPRDSKEIHVRVSFQNCGIALHYITRVHVYERIHVYSLVLCLLLVMHIV